MWQHYVVTLDGAGNAAVYINGAAVSAPPNRGQQPWPANVVPRALLLGAGQFAGSLSDVQFALGVVFSAYDAANLAAGRGCPAPPPPPPSPSPSPPPPDALPVVFEPFYNPLAHPTDGLSTRGMSSVSPGSYVFRVRARVPRRGPHGPAGTLLTPPGPRADVQAVQRLRDHDGGPRLL